jgi:hypothetical protein
MSPLTLSRPRLTETKTSADNVAGFRFRPGPRPLSSLPNHIMRPPTHEEREAVRSSLNGARSGIYFLLRPDGLCKIGKARYLQTRVLRLQKENGHALTLWHVVGVASFEHERWFHRRFAHCRIEGEWFALSEEDLAWVKSLTTSPVPVRVREPFNWGDR